MGFRNFTRAPFWSRLFKVAMVLWYIFGIIMTIIMIAERPWELTQYAPADMSQWSSAAQLGGYVALYYWVWAPFIILITPLLVLWIMRLLRNTIEYLISGPEPE